MAIQNFETIVEMVEENITRDKDEISLMISKHLALSDRRTSEFFQNIDSEERTLQQYIIYRKNMRALEEFISGTTRDAACEKYNIDGSNFFKQMKKMFPGKTLTELREEKFQCPPPVSLSEITKGKGLKMERKKCSNEDERKYIEEIQRLISENTDLRTELSNRTLEKTTNSSEEKRIKFNRDTYEMFLEIEDARVIYGFSVSEILHLYKKSLHSKKSLRELCGEALESCYFEFEKEVIPNKEEWIYHLNDEMDLGESYAMYYGDDDPYEKQYDPFATTDEEWIMQENYEDMPDYEDFIELEEENDMEIERMIDAIEKNERKNNKNDGKTRREHEESMVNPVLDDEDIPF